MQSIHAALGGAGCFGDAAVALDGVERGVAIGCGVAATAALVHGIVLAATRPDGTRHGAKRKHRALMPAPWFSHGTAGVALNGVF